MRAYRFDNFESIDSLTLHDEPMPTPQRGEVLVRIHSVSLNYRDISIVQGNYVKRAKVGLVPCSDAAGVVVEVGEGVNSLSRGDRVISAFHARWFGGRPPFIGSSNDSYGNMIDGWLCEFKVVSQEALVRVPDSMSFAAASTLPCAGLTAWNALSGPMPIRAGDSVLTLGSGGVSVFAIQLAKAVGAKVIATTSSAAKGEKLKALGADHVLNYSESPEWGKQVKELTGGTGVDCVVEVGGPATINQSLHAVRWGGDVVLIGFLSEDNPGIDYFHLKQSGAVVRSVSVGDRSMLQNLVRAVDESAIAPVIDSTFDFENSIAAFKHLAAQKHIGKIVIRVHE